MAEQKKSSLRNIAEIGAVAVLALAAFFYFSPPSQPTLKEYVAKTGGQAKVIKSGIIKLAGSNASCAKAEIGKNDKTNIDNSQSLLKYFPLVLDNNFGDHGGAFTKSGFIVLNPKYLFSLPKVQQLFTFHHECGHMQGIVSELDADCYSIIRGRKNGWLNKKGLDALCAYWRPKKGNAVHPSGIKRCENMIKCFNRK